MLTPPTYKAYTNLSTRAAVSALSRGHCDTSSLSIRPHLTSPETGVGVLELEVAGEVFDVVPHGQSVTGSDFRSLVIRKDLTAT